MSVGMKRHGKTQWGDGEEGKEERMGKEENDWVRMGDDGRKKGIERGDWLRVI